MLPAEIFAAAAFSTQTDATDDGIETVVVYDSTETATLYSINRNTNELLYHRALLVPCETFERAYLQEMNAIAATIAFVAKYRVIATFNDCRTYFDIDFEQGTATEMPKNITPFGARISNPFSWGANNHTCIMVGFIVTDELNPGTESLQHVQIYDTKENRIVLRPFHIASTPRVDMLRIHAEPLKDKSAVFFLACFQHGFSVIVLCPDETIAVLGSVQQDIEKMEFGPGYITGIGSAPDLDGQICILNSAGTGHDWNLNETFRVKGAPTKPRRIPIKERCLYPKRGMVNVYNMLSTSNITITSSMVIIHASDKRICLETKDYDGDAPCNTDLEHQNETSLEEKIASLDTKQTPEE
jgi:hypothetical protein